MLEDRASGDRDFTYTIVNQDGSINTRTMNYNDAPHPSVGDWANYGAEGDEQYDHALGVADFSDCVDTDIVERVLPDVAVGAVRILLKSSYCSKRT